MDAQAESDVVVVTTTEVESVRVGEALRVAVGRRLTEKQALPGSDSLAAELDVFLRDAHLHLGRPVVAQ